MLSCSAVSGICTIYLDTQMFTIIFKYSNNFNFECDKLNVVLE